MMDISFEEMKEQLLLKQHFFLIHEAAFNILNQMQHLRLPKIEFRKTLGETYHWYVSLINPKPKQKFGIAEISKSYSFEDQLDAGTITVREEVMPLGTKLLQAEEQLNKITP